MPLAAGDRLGSYDILAPIGAGGMGEVYRARDSRLDRDVAIKVLPAHLAADEAARARFEREARAVAALSHPNILSVYDVGTDRGLAYVVMELLEGETLRDRLTAIAGAGRAAAGLPIRKAIQIGVDLANGLAAAHDRQIVHRDLKPENVFLASDGRVKILDFGLARQGAPAAGATDSLTQMQTDPGTVLGTVGYMAPEQVKGLAVDHRADIFSLGCVLYEMASGRQAFVRDTAAETMTAVLRDEPADLARDSAVIPSAFEPIIRHCLEKRPEERFQSARDLAFALQSIGSVQPASGAAAVATGDRPKPQTAASRLGVRVALALAGAVLLFAAGRYSTGSSQAGGPTVAQFQQVTDFAGVETTPTLSPDGKTIVYSSDATGGFQLYALRVGGRSPVALTTESENTTPAFSPDGDHIAFRSTRDGGGLFLMTSSGESVTRVSDTGFSPAWSPDGRELVASRGAFTSPADLGSIVPGLIAIDVKTGQKRDILRHGVTLQPAWSPHGYRIAYFGLRSGGGQRDIWTVPADGSAADKDGDSVTNDPALDWSPVWAPDGSHLYFSSNRGGTMNLWRVAIDERTGAVRGEPEPVTTPSGWSGMMSFSRDGSTMAFASLEWRSTLLRQGFDAAREALVGPPIAILKGSRPIRDHDISPDGQWVAFNESRTQEDLFVARTDGSQYRRLTDDAARDRGPAWSPDGSRIVLYSDRGGASDLWTIRPDGGDLEPVTKGASANFAVWSPDGARLAFSGINAKGLTIVSSASQATTSLPVEPPLNTTDGYWPFAWSRDGARLAGIDVTPSGSIDRVVIYDVASKRYRPVAAAQLRPGWMVPAWLADGRRMLVRTMDGVFVVNADTGAAKPLVSVRGYGIGRSLSLARDNTWFSYTETGTEGDIWVAMLKKNPR
jgi:eukaryotic-like serine/threonine-protein kinase